MTSGAHLLISFQDASLVNFDHTIKSHLKHCASMCGGDSKEFDRLWWRGYDHWRGDHKKCTRYLHMCMVIFTCGGGVSTLSLSLSLSLSLQ